MPMKYIRADIKALREYSDVLAAVMEDYSEGGVVIDDPMDFSDAVNASVYYDGQDAIPEAGNSVTVSAYIPLESFPGLKEEMELRIKTFNEETGSSIALLYSEYEDKDYTEEWKSFHKPIEFDNFVIAPNWTEEKFSKRVIKLNIGSAFGTGQHESTMLALKAIDGLNLSSKSVADLGCGSGILGLAGAARGANKVWMCDIEPVTEAIGNAEANGFAAIVQAEQKDLKKLRVKADLVIANIYATITVKYEKDIKRIVKKGGELIISGLYKEGADAVRGVFSEFTLLSEERMGDWTCLTYRKE